MPGMFSRSNVNKILTANQMELRKIVDCQVKAVEGPT